MTELQDMSPYAVFARHCAQGELAFQVDVDNRAVFYPRLCAPGHGGPVDWRVSAGIGTVHATTVVHPRDGKPYIRLRRAVHADGRLIGSAPFGEADQS